MTRQKRSGRLFWKFFFVQWSALMLTAGGGFLYMHLRGIPPPPGEWLLFGFLPMAPLLTGTLVVSLTSLALAWYLSSPLRVLSWALHEVAAGRLETRVQARIGHRNDELADLGEDFDRMAQQLQQLTQSRNELLHDISHELRSPLARLQVAIGLLKQDPVQHGDMLERIERESARLDALIEELLTWHRLEAGVAPPPVSRLDVLELLHAITEDADFEAQSEGKAVRIEAAGQFVAEVHGELLYRAFENVIRNAIKFTAPGSEVWVRAAVDEASGALHCHIDDQGPGVPADALEAMFEPFARVAGSEGVKGVGLGLAIARRAMELHGGHIRAQPGAQAGLRVSLVLPPTRV